MSFVVKINVDPMASLSEVFEVMEDYDSPTILRYQGYDLGGPSIVLEFSCYDTCLDFLKTIHTSGTPLEKLKSQIYRAESHCLAH